MSFVCSSCGAARAAVRSNATATLVAPLTQIVSQLFFCVSLPGGSLQDSGLVPQLVADLFARVSTDTRYTYSIEVAFCQARSASNGSRGWRPLTASASASSVTLTHAIPHVTTLSSCDAYRYTMRLWTTF